MSSALLFDASNLKVLIRDHKVGLHLLQCLGRDGVDSKLALALSEAEPQLAPCRMARSLAKELGHFRAAIAARQGCLVRIVLRSHLFVFYLSEVSAESLDVVAVVMRSIFF